MGKLSFFSQKMWTDKIPSVSSSNGFVWKLVTSKIPCFIIIFACDMAIFGLYPIYLFPNIQIPSWNPSFSACFSAALAFRLPLPMRFVELSHCIPQLLHGFLLLLGPAASVAPGLMAILIGKMDENGSFKPVDFGVSHCQKSHRAPVECKLQRRLLPAEWLLVECPAQRYWSGPASPAGLRNWLWHLCHFLCFKVKRFDMSKTIRGCEICCVMLIHPEDFEGLA